MRFRLLAGKHYAEGPTGPNGERTELEYKAGDVIETDIPLDKKFNKRGMPPKFAREFASADAGVRMKGESIAAFRERLNALIAEEEAKELPSSMDDMSIDQLKRYAAENDVPLGDAATREEIVARIDGALALGV